MAPVGESREKAFCVSFSTQASAWEPGLNVGRLDLSFLRAYRVYSRSLQKKTIERVINQAINSNAWLIFYTHDVSHDPSPWGITVADLNWLAGICSSSPVKSLNLGQVLDQL